jgi:hypothetical protein
MPMHHHPSFPRRLTMERLNITRTHNKQSRSKLSYEVVLAPKGRLEQPLESSLRGLDWKLSFKDIYATGRLEFKIGA